MVRKVLKAEEQLIRILGGGGGLEEGWRSHHFIVRFAGLTPLAFPLYDKFRDPQENALDFGVREGADGFASFVGEIDG